MQSLSAKRIAAATAGAILLGASLFAAAPPITIGNTEIINQNGKPVVKVVVGSNAKITDGIAAANIAAVIGSLAYGQKTISAVLQGEATCTVGGAGEGTCPVSDEKVKLEINVPGTQVVAGAYGFRTYIYGYVDNDVRTEDDQSKTDDTALEITADQFSAFAEKTSSVATVSGSFKIKEKAYTKTDQLAQYDTATGKYKVTPSELKYIISFDHDTWGGLPVCTKEEVMESGTYTTSAALEGNCTPQDTYLLERQRLKIKFLGEDWVITDMTANGSIKLAKESTPATVVKVGENISSGAYTVKLASITIPTDSYPNGQAVIEIYDATGTKVKDAVLDPAQPSHEITLPNGDKITIKIYKQSSALDPASRWSELAVISQEIELKDGKVSTDSSNPNYNWTASLGWAKYKSGSGIENVLKNITLTRESMPELSEGGAIDIIGEPALYQLSLAGLTLTDANYQSLTMTIGKTRTSTYYESEEATSTTSIGETKDLVCLTSDKKAFVSSEIKSGDNRYKVCYSLDEGVPFMQEKPDKGLVAVLDEFGSPELIDTGDENLNINVFNGSAWELKAVYNSSVSGNTLYARSIDNSAGNVYYSFKLAPAVEGVEAKSNETKLFRLYNATGSQLANLTGVNDDHYALYNEGELWVINKSYIPSTAPQPWVFENASLTFYIPDTGYYKTKINITRSDGNIIITEYADKSTGTSLPIYTKVKADGSSVTFKSLADSESKVTVNYYTAAGGLSGNVDREVGYVNQRGSKLVSRGASEIVFKIAEKTGELQYWLKGTGITIGAGVSEVTLKEGETTTVGDITIKVKDISQTVGACSVAEGTCTVDTTGLKAMLDTGKASETVAVPYKFAPTDRLVVLDKEAPTTENLILVGGPMVNSLTAQAIQGKDIVFDKPGVKYAQEVETGKIIVAGYTAEDTIDAAADFIAALLAKA